MTRLSQVQIADYLKRKDVVFVPVGAVETNGIMPSDRDYVSPLAYALSAAEDTDALFMPGLIWSYPGTTLIAPSTVYLSPSAGAAYLKIIAKSLLRQGFLRQVLISSGQGPAPLTVGTMVREFFDEMHVPILYVEMESLLPKLNLKIGAEARSKMIYGAHYVAGRIEDLPLRGDYGPEASSAEANAAENEGLAELGKLGYSGSLFLGSWIPNVMAHGSGGPVLPATAEERELWGKQGKETIVSIVKAMRLNEALNALQKHDTFTREHIIPKHSALLPGPSDQH
jgi:creatinine amidohydrolase